MAWFLTASGPCVAKSVPGTEQLDFDVKLLGFKYWHYLSFLKGPTKPARRPNISCGLQWVKSVTKYRVVEAQPGTKTCRLLTFCCHSACVYSLVTQLPCAGVLSVQR